MYYDRINTLNANFQHLNTNLIITKNNIDQRLQNGLTPLANAVIDKNVQLVEQLLKLGANTEIEFEWKDERGKYNATPLYYSATFMIDKITEKLIESNANIYYEPKLDGEILFPTLYTLLLNPYFANKLSSQHINIDRKYNGMTLLFMATMVNNSKLVKTLLDLGADINIEVDEFGKTPLMASIYQYNIDIMKLLLEHGADINEKYSSTNSVSPLKDIIYANKEDGIEILELAIKYNLDLNGELATTNDNIILSPLIAAVVYKNVKALKLFIEAGAFVDLAFKRGKTALFFSVKQNNTEMIELLAENGADATLKDDNDISIVEFAKNNCSKEVVDILMKNTSMTTSKQVDTKESFYLENDGLSPLDNIIGLDNIKDEIKSIISNIKIEKLRNRGKEIIPGHYIFKGNPGTGKTTIARLMSNIFKELEILKKGHLVEVTREDLVAMHIGETALVTKKKLEEALGGILFIDEAYSLARGGKNDFGREAIDTIVPFMENNRKDFTLIIAGYPNEIDEFLGMNTGLKSRFDNSFDFIDYTNEEMLDIFKIKLKSEEFYMGEGVEELLMHIFQNVRESSRYFGNGREARKIFEKVYDNLNQRLVTLDDLVEGDPRLFTITVNDLDMD